MFRTPFAIMAFMSFSAMPVMAQTTPPESASDATTIMDKQAGNQQPPTDNTLSNSEVKSLQGQGSAGSDSMANAPSVSGTTAIYKDKTGSAEKTEGQ